jgi:colicin import membrane protein
MSSIEMINVVSVTSLLVKTLENATREYARECIRACALFYGFSSDEALLKLNLENLAIQVRDMKKRGSGSKKVSENKVSENKVSEKKKPARFPLPFVASLVCEDGCHGLAYNMGLFTQCPRVRMNEGNYCKGCQSETDLNGKPANGTIEERRSSGLMEFKDSKGRRPVAYSKIMEKYKVNREEVEVEAGMELDEMHYAVVVVEPKKKADKKEKSSKDKKTKEVVVDDLFAGLEDIEEEEVVVEKVVENKVVKNKQEKVVKNKQEKVVEDAELAKKAEEKARKDAELAKKAEEKAAKDAELALKKQQQAEEKAAKDAELAQKKAEAKAIKDAELAKKAEEKAAKDAEAKAIKDAKDAEAKAIKDAKDAEAKAIKDAKDAELAQKKAEAKAVKDAELAKKAEEAEKKKAELALKKQQEADAKKAEPKKQKEGTRTIVATNARFKVGDKVEYRNEKGEVSKGTVSEVKMGKSFVEYELQMEDGSCMPAAPEGNIMAAKVEADAGAAPKKVTVKRITIGGKQYLKTADNLLYDPETKEEMGIYDPITNTIKELPDDSEDEVEEDGYDSE